MLQAKLIYADYDVHLSASLTTAIIFHQLFEGLSLGIRIAALPPSKEKDGLQPLSDDQSRLAISSGASTLEDSPLNVRHKVSSVMSLLSDAVEAVS